MQCAAVSNRLRKRLAVMPPPDRFARQIKESRTRGLHRRTLYVMVIHVPLRRFNAELRENPIWRNVVIKQNYDRV